MEWKKITGFSWQKLTMWLGLIALSIMMAACRNSSSNSDTETLKYTGQTGQAVIDAANARSLSTEALGLGFLDGTQTELTPIEKSVEILAGASVKGEADVPVIGMIDLLQRASRPLDMAFQPLFGGPVFDIGDIEHLISQNTGSDTAFPNISGEGSFDSTITETMDSETSARYEGTLTFTDAVHCMSGDSEDCREKNTYNGALTYKIIFSFELPSPLPEDWPADWNDRSIFEKVFYVNNPEKEYPADYQAWNAAEEMCYLISNVNRSHVATDYTVNSNGIFTVKTAINGTVYKMIDENPVQATIVNGIDGSFTKKNLSALPLEGGEFGTSASEISTVFTGDLDVTLDMTTAESTIALNFSGVDTSVAVSFKDVDSKLPKNEGVAESPAITQNDDTTRIEVSGNASLSLNAETPSDSLNLTGSLNGGKIIFSVNENEIGEETPGGDPIQTSDTEETFFGLSGSLDLNAEYTTHLLSPVTQTLGLTVNVGTVQFTYTDSEKATYKEPYDEPWEGATDEYAFKIGVIVDGDITVTNGVEPISLVGDLAFDLEHNDSEDSANNTDSTSGSLVINKLGLTTDTIDVAVNGTITFDVAYQPPAVARLEEEEPVLNLAMDLLLQNKKQNKTYWLNDYKISTQIAYGPKADSLATDGLNISVEGRYYHPDYGYVDITTGVTPFVINAEAISRSLYNNDKSTLLRALFPIQGTLTLQGAEGTQSLLEALSAEDTASGYVLPTGYTIHLDTDGDGAMDASGTYSWPNLRELIESVWLTRLLFNASDLLFNYRPE